MPSKDQLHRFIFDQTDIRGEIIHLDETIKAQNAIHPLPPLVQKLLGEFMVAAALMSSTLKFDGIFTLQARGSGSVPLIMAEVSENQHLRAIAHLNEHVDLPEQAEPNLPELIGTDAVLSIIIDPIKGERYQGIVPLDAATLAECVEHYFHQSEQLPTKLWLVSDDKQAAGFFLQRLPQQLADSETNDDAWHNRVQLANTLTADELMNLPHETLLMRLFHEEGVRIFDPKALSFKCSCSKTRTSNALVQLGKEELDSIIEEQGLISVDCQFCGHQYRFDENDVEQLFSPPTQH